MKRGWFVFIVLVVLAYVFGMFYYDSKNKETNLSPGSCGCSYEEGDSFSNSMIVTGIMKDTCIATNICTRGYCIIEYGDPNSNERFTSTVLCE